MYYIVDDFSTNSFVTLTFPSILPQPSLPVQTRVCRVADRLSSCLCSPHSQKQDNLWASRFGNTSSRGPHN